MDPKPPPGPPTEDAGDRPPHVTLRFACSLSLTAACLSALLAAALEAPAAARAWSELQDPATSADAVTAGIFLAAIRWFIWLPTLLPAVALHALGWRRLAAVTGVGVLAAVTASNGVFIVLAERTGVRWTDNIEAAFAPGAIDLIGGFRVLMVALGGCFLAAALVVAAMLLLVRLAVQRVPNRWAAVAPLLLVVIGFVAWWTVRPAVIAAARPVVLLSSLVDLPMPPRSADAASFDRSLNRESAALLAAAAEAIDHPEEPIPPRSAAISAWRLPDIVIVLNETFRADLLNREVMPRLLTRSAQGLLSLEHRSAGNASELGIYGLLRAEIPAHFQTQTARPFRMPALTRWARGRGYRTSWLSNGVSAGFKGLESVLNTSSFDTIEEGIEGESRGFASGDEAIFHRVAEELRAGPSGSPRLYVIFGMGLHYPYGYDNEGPWAVGTQPRWASDFPSDQQAQVVRYANAAYRLDGVLDEFLEALDLTRTIVIITGDHGESFRDDGLEGHAGAPSDAQTRVPFLLLGSGVSSRTLRVPTSHLDVVPTLAHLVGGDPVRIGHGRSLMVDPPADRAVPIVALGQRHPHDLDPDRESSLVAVGPGVRDRLFLRYTTSTKSEPAKLRSEGWVDVDGRYTDSLPPPLSPGAAAALLRATLQPLLPEP